MIFSQPTKILKFNTTNNILLKEKIMEKTGLHLNLFLELINVNHYNDIFKKN
jgi:hypothetical protein